MQISFLTNNVIKIHHVLKMNLTYAHILDHRKQILMKIILVKININVWIIFQMLKIVNNVMSQVEK